MHARDGRTTRTDCVIVGGRCARTLRRDPAQGVHGVGATVTARLGGSEVKHRPIRRSITPSLAALAAVGLLAGCGGSSSGEQAAATATPTTPAQQASTAATTTATATGTTTGSGETPTQTTTDPKSQQREIPVSAAARTLKAGGLKVTLKVHKLVDPVVTSVDTPQKGNRFVGVFMDTDVSGKFEPTRVRADATLKTTDGAVSNVRIIADGDCSGGFYPAALVVTTKKTVTGCIGFEVPKKATPESITIGVTNKGKGQQATWTLPASK